jgi:hypothetical protein
MFRSYDHLQVEIYTIYIYNIYIYSIFLIRYCELPLGAELSKSNELHFYSRGKIKFKFVHVLS